MDGWSQSQQKDAKEWDEGDCGWKWKEWYATTEVMARNHGRNDTTHTHTQKKYTLDVARWVHCGNWVTSRQPTTMHTSKWHYTSRCFSLRPPLYPLPFVFILTSTLSSYSFIYRLRPKKNPHVFHIPYTTHFYPKAGKQTYKIPHGNFKSLAPKRVSVWTYQSEVCPEISLP